VDHIPTVLQQKWSAGRDHAGDRLARMEEDGVTTSVTTDVPPPRRCSARGRVEAAPRGSDYALLLGLYLGCSFALNHKGIPTLDRNDKTEFLLRQVLTAQNIRGGRITDFALGGLNHQIEHHLLPSMPRPDLCRAQTLVRAFSDRHGVAYRETGLLQSYTQVLRHLHAVGGPLRPEH
jgi:hypothetical protein